MGELSWIVPQYFRFVRGCWMEKAVSREESSVWKPHDSWLPFLTSRRQLKSGTKSWLAHRGLLNDAGRFELSSNSQAVLDGQVRKPESGSSQPAYNRSKYCWRFGFNPLTLGVRRWYSDSNVVVVCASSKWLAWFAWKARWTCRARVLVTCWFTRRPGSCWLDITNKHERYKQSHNRALEYISARLSRLIVIKGFF